MNISIEELRNKVLELEQALLDSNRGLPTLLRTIHNNLREDPSLVTLLSEEEIGKIVLGLMVQTQTTIATDVAKKGSKKASGLSLTDLC